MKTTYSKIYNLLTTDKRRTAVILLALIMIGMLFEVLGIGLLVPVIVLLLEDNLATSYPIVQPALDALGNPGHEAQIQIIMITLVCVYLIKNLYLAFLGWWEARFTTGLQVELSHRLFTIYLHQPYTFHLQRNSAQLIRNISGEVGQFITRGVSPVINFIAEVLVLFGIVFLLLLVEPLGSLIIFLVMFTAAWSFHRSTRARITQWGQKRQYHDGQRIQHLNQGLGGVKDVKLLGREDNFLMRYHLHNNKSAHMAQFLQVLQKLPRLWLELLAVVGFAALVLIMLAQGREMHTIVPIMGLFAAAAFRLMPSVNRILSSIQSLRYGLPVINNLYEELRLSVPEPDVQSSDKYTVFQNEICLFDITYNYPNTSTSALASISIKIQHGQSVGFIGPSGSGKSTLIDVILGLLTPQSGTVIVDGQDIQLALRQWQNKIGYVPQSIYLTDDTFRRNIAFGLSDDLIDDEAVIRAIKAAQLDDFIFSLPDDMETVVGERGVRISGGQRQRIGIARALYHDPEILVMDEATSALDNSTEDDVMQAVMALHGNKTIIIVAHRLTTVEHCDYLYQLEGGKIIKHGIPEELLEIH